MISHVDTYKHTDQGIAAYVDYLNSIRLSELMSSINTILQAETKKLANLDSRKFNALSHIERSTSNIEKLIDSQRGGPFGVNGFIAEFAEEGIRNARNAYTGLQETVSVINNNGPADLKIGSNDIQMKFYRNPTEGLKLASNYSDMSMMYPSDQAELYNKIMRGDTDIVFNNEKLLPNQIDKIRSLIEDESIRRNEPYNKWIHASELKYDEVQKENIQETLNSSKDSILRDSEHEQEEISSNSRKEQAAAQKKAAPSFSEAHKVAAAGAAFQGGLNLSVFIYNRHKEGKKVWEFESEDWKEAGLKVGEGSLKGGITGYSIYGLTNICHLSAPSAGAITSGTYGLFRAIIQYRTGKIDDDDFIDLLVLNATDSTGAAIGAAIGQALIPVPILGAVIGSITLSTIQGLGKNVLNKQERKLLDEYQMELNAHLEKLDKIHRKIYEQRIKRYNELGELQAYSFDININIALKLNGSIDLARKVGVADDKILHNKMEIDDYFLI